LKSRGGENFAYRLRVAPAPNKTNVPPGFRLRFPERQIALARGQEVKVRVTAERFGGFQGEIDLVFENLSAGVTATGTKIARQKPNTDVVLKTNGSVKIGLTALHAHGRGEIESTK